MTGEPQNRSEHEREPDEYEPVGEAMSATSFAWAFSLSGWGGDTAHRCSALNVATTIVCVTDLPQKGDII